MQPSQLSWLSFLRLLSSDQLAGPVWLLEWHCYCSSYFSSMERVPGTVLLPTQRSRYHLLDRLVIWHSVKFSYPCQVLMDL